MDAAIAIRQLFAEEHVSASAIGTWIRCPRQYRFKYVDRRQPESKASALAFGSAIHHSLAVYYGKLRDIDPEPTAEELAAVFRDEWEKQLDTDLPVLFGDKEDEASLTDLGVRMLAVFLEKAQLPAEVVEIELPFSIELTDPETGEELPRLVGVLDAVVKDRDGKFRVLEHKTAAKRWAPDKLASDLQLTAYSMVAPQLGLGEAQVTVQLLLKQKTPDFEVLHAVRTDADRRDFLDTAVGVLRAVRAEVFHPIRDWQCRGCAFASACLAG
jgi:CRISPR/Cas system-associated exonuclease Cas4 (RecB family)